MRRSERITAWAGAVALATAAVAAAGFLVANGSRPLPRAENASERIPDDLVWPVFEHCSRPEDPWSYAIDGWTVDWTDGTVRVSGIGPGARTGEARALIESINRCFAGFSFEQTLVDYSANRIDTPAERLLAYDVASRWLIPCLVGHGVDDGHRPGAAEYLDDQAAPWYSYYTTLGAGELDGLLAARRTCGPGSLPYEL